MRKQHINAPVNITAVGFRNNLSTYPKRMEYKGFTYNFIDAGLRFIVKSGGMIREFLTLSDGVSDYYLRKDEHSVNWILLKIV